MSDARFAKLVEAFFALVLWAWFVACISVCTYLVFWKGFSGWWYVLASLLGTAASSSSSDEAKP